jgi:hypothetical protein
MYYHEDMTHRVEWNPEHEAEAEQAMSDVLDRFDSWEGSRYKVSRETAQEINARYRELIEANPDIDTTT